MAALRKFREVPAPRDGRAAAADPLSDLIKRVARRDRAAFDALYAESSAKLFSVTLRILKNRAEAEEALQEIYVKVWRSADQYQATEVGAMAWLLAVARHHSIDRLRSRRAAEAVKAAQAEEIETLGSLLAPTTPEEAAIRGSERAYLERCLSKLEPERAALVRGAYLEGKSYKELAEEQGAPVNTVRTWLRRSLKRLREYLDE
ncbi:MAG: sigma-70 family RNA polymerase sigma factor [Neomegalonema sp.]|nr:sigma-70 family RNA polymerase sigma factor [Neomegalonema sp.]